MTDGPNTGWGVDFDAPPPQRRQAWGAAAPQTGRPARRGEQPAEAAEAIPAPVWSSLTPPAVEPVDLGDENVIDVDVVEDAPHEPAPPTFAIDPAFAALAPAPGTAAATVNPADIFGDAEPHEAPDPVPAEHPATAPEHQSPTVAAAPAADSVVEPEPEPEPVAPAFDSPAEASQEPAPAASAPAGFGSSTSFYLPARVESSPGAGVEAVATPTTDLAAMFDDAQPVAAPSQPGPSAVVVAEGSSFAARRDALERARAASSADVFHINDGHDDATASRYLNADRYQRHVDQLLGLAAGGDPRLQALINNLKLTRDKALDARQRAQYEEALMPLMQAHGVAFASPSDHKPIFDIAYDELIGIGPLGPLWRDDDVTEIMVSGPDKVTVERNGRILPTPVRFQDSDHLERTARQLSSTIDDRTVSRNNALVTAQLPGARVQFVMSPVAPTAGVIIVIRKFRDLFGMNDLLRFGSLDDSVAAFLCDTVAARANILVSGGTGSGKTTMINALSSFIPDTERVVTIEDALELQLSNTHVESLLTKESASGDDQLIIGQAELLRATLRMRPDRIIVGEIRDGRGCSVMLQAANTGHDGTMTTVHANTPDLAVERMADLLREERPLPDDVAKNQVTSAINVIVQIVKKRGRRYISAISVVNGGRDPHRQLTTPIFSGDFPVGAKNPVFVKVGSLGSDTELAQKMIDAGLDPQVWS